jgi:hypothetical protein
MKNIYLEAPTATDNPDLERQRDAENDFNILDDICGDLISLITKVQDYDSAGALAQPVLPLEILTVNNSNVQSAVELGSMLNREWSREKFDTLGLMVDGLDDLLINCLRLHAEQAEDAITVNDAVIQEDGK